MSERPRAGAAAGAAEGRRARVRCVVAATARIADPGDVLGREARSRLPAASGLSPEGVELALATALERRVTEPQLDRLLAWAGDAEVAWVVASANVCTAAARSIALAAATSCDVRVCPSRRDPVDRKSVV